MKILPQPGKESLFTGFSSGLFLASGYLHGNWRLPG
jgi:hypothetical protein